MRRAAWLFLLASAACNENLSHTAPPMDHFFTPAGIALTPVAGGNSTSGTNEALLVVSANYDLRYDKNEGATLLSVDPDAYDAATGLGSAGRPDNALLKLGPGAQLGSYAGPVTVADSRTCSSWLGGARAFVASRYTRFLYSFPIGLDGSVAPCQGPLCQLDLDPDLTDPAAIGVACRTEAPLRHSLFVGYLRSPQLGAIGAGTAWVTEFDLDNLLAKPRTFALGPGPVGEMAYDALSDRLYAVGRFAGLTAPLFILNLTSCSPSDAACALPQVQSVDLYSSLQGAELVSIALSNPQPGRPRLAYISARVYDEAYAAAIRARPNYDVGGALLVVELDENVVGDPLARVRKVVPIGLGAGSVRVLPVRPGLGDLVVVPSSGDGALYLYDDELGAVSRVITIDEVTGAPEVGRVPVVAAVRDLGTEALVYVAAFSDWTVSVLRVPLANPGEADLLRYTSGTLAGKPLRIGSPNQ